MAGFTSDAILLRKIEYGDHDYIITFLTENLGKVSVMAKNAKKSVKRFQGALDSFSLMNIECTYSKTRRDALAFLMSARLEQPFAGIRTDAVKTGYASYWIEILHSYLEAEKEQVELYRLLMDSLAALDKGVIAKEVLNLLFQIRFMTIAGFSPDFVCCGKCRVPLDRIREGNVVFDFKDGRFFCPRCENSTAATGIKVSKGTLKQLFWINNNGMQKVERIRFSPVSIREGEKLLEAFVPCHMGRDFKSLGFLKRVRS